MGITHTTVAVKSMSNGKTSWKAVFLVDSGASVSLIPSHVLRRLGIKPFRRDRYELADGTAVDMDIGFALLTVKGITVGNEVAFGPDDCEPLLGAPAMQAANLVWDARREELVPAPRLKPLKPLVRPAVRTATGPRGQPCSSRRSKPAKVIRLEDLATRAPVRGGAWRVLFGEHRAPDERPDSGRADRPAARDDADRAE